MDEDQGMDLFEIAAALGIDNLPATFLRSLLQLDQEQRALELGAARGAARILESQRRLNLATAARCAKQLRAHLVDGARGAAAAVPYADILVALTADDHEGGDLQCQ